MIESDTVDTAISLAKNVASLVKKIDWYKTEKGAPPNKMLDDLVKMEHSLDNLVAKLLLKEIDLKNLILSNDKLTEDSALELELSYKRATCVTTYDQKYAKLFFLPFLYLQEKNGSKTGLINFNQTKLETLKSFILDFLKNKFKENDVEVKLYPHPIFDCLINENEEKYLPVLHEATLNEEKVNLEKYFKAHGDLVNSPTDEKNSGWSMGIFSFSILHSDLNILESLNFEEYSEDFIEEFEEIFDPSSSCYYISPIDPMLLINEGTKHLWLKQLDLIVDDLFNSKKPKELMTISAMFVWDDNDLAEILLDFECENKNYKKRLARPALLNESQGDLAAFLVTYEKLIRPDCQITINHVKGSSFYSDNYPDD